MKIYLEFEIPKESEKYAIALYGHKYRRIIDEFQSLLLSQNELTLIEDIKQKFNRIKIEILSGD